MDYNFNGFIEEISLISVDCFLNDNLKKSELLFLSHCHTDHMKGLYENNVEISKSNKKIYTSPISTMILKNKYPHLGPKIIPLDMKYTHNFTLSNDTKLAVTLIPAGHCPGSVMFLFETETSSMENTEIKRILFTGDYRIDPKDLPKFKPFQDGFGNVKKIDKIYLDTTFFLQRYQFFPPRQESVDRILTLIENNLSAGKLVYLNISAYYGYEFLFMEIYKKFQTPIHVNRTLYETYSIIPELDKALTLDASSTKIHSCCSDNQFNKLCLSHVPSNVKSLRISALKWINFEHRDFEETENSVCYSNHASYSEGKGFLQFLKPKQVVSLISYQDKTKNDKNEVMELIQSALDEIKNDSEGTSLKRKTSLFDIHDNDESPKKSTIDENKIKKMNFLDSPPRDD